ncbi:hypothetical protein C2E21_7314 [Chlorella sorokiniana]|uniref:Uncharacterized protein n=1 Tax=Chlorella sorokiniana TaxID=3076 RepID=A0A2P6THX1_CHLSO|nr:hypothetical protein C2E21_7314 [Chlorella sorokiniana]|eukprot:PRW33895.1 hypothetical protein C2E21_7314 [Chlorella sorokiniana]
MLRACVLALLLFAAHTSLPVGAQMEGTFCRRVRDDATALSLTALDGSTGPAVANGDQLSYTGLKLQGPGDAWWAVVYGADGVIYKYNAAGLTYCDPPGCDAKEGSQYHNEEGTSCNEDSECCNGLLCTDRGENTVSLSQENDSSAIVTFSTSDASALLPKRCVSAETNTGTGGSDDPPAKGDNTGDTVASFDVSGEFLPGLDKCGTSEFDAAASTAEIQAWFAEHGEAAAAACQSATLDLDALCSCIATTLTYQGPDLCPPCWKDAVEASTPLECRTALSKSTTSDMGIVSYGAETSAFFSLCHVSY